MRTGDHDVDAIHHDLNLSDLLIQLWASTGRMRGENRDKALELATASGLAHDAEIIRNRGDGIFTEPKPRGENHG